MDAPVNYGISSSNETPLHIASLSGHLEIVKYLIDRGADPNATTSTKNETPVHYICGHNPHGRTQILDVLIKNGARPSITTQPVQAKKMGPKTLGENNEEEDVRPEELKEAATKSAFETCEENNFDIKSHVLSHWSQDELFELVEEHPDFDYSRREIYRAN